ncbi:MAG: hypothetical protein AAGG46_08825 [Planctomycetota bacterium]
MPDDTDSPELEQAQAAQQLLVDEALPAMFAAYDAAVEDGIETPAVVVLDCEDELGGAIARALLGEEVVDDAIADQQAEDADIVTVFTAAYGWDDCREQATTYFPYLAEAFDQGPPDDGFLALGVTAGGASAFTAPFDARPE